MNMPGCAAGRKCVGWPRSGPPGSMRLFGPIGTSMRLLEVAIQVADEEVVAAVGVVEPALEGAGDARRRTAARRL